MGSTINTSSNAVPANDVSGVAPDTADITPPRRDHKLSLVESIGPGGGSFGIRYRPPGTGFYIEPGIYETFHRVTPPSDDPFGRYVGVDINDTSSFVAISNDPGMLSDGFLNSLDSNPFRCRLGFQGDILPNKVFGPTFDVSFDPVQTAVAAVRGTEVFNYAFDQGEQAIAPLNPYVGSDFDAASDTARTAGATTLGIASGIGGFAQSLSLGVGFHVRPLEHFDFGMTAGTTGLGVYRAAMVYVDTQDTAAAVLSATEIKAQATWRF